MAKTKTSVDLLLTKTEKAKVMRMAKKVGQTPDRFATEAVLEFRQTLLDNPDRIGIIRRESEKR
jgi:hypothetical protein